MTAGYKFPGLQERLKRRLMELGYVKDDRPDYRRFALERGYDPMYLWRWINGKSAPSLDAARQLIDDLGVSLSWLLLGEESAPSPARPRATRRRPAPIAGGSGAAAPLPASPVGDPLPLIRPWRHRAAAWWAAVSLKGLLPPANLSARPMLLVWA